MPSIHGFRRLSHLGRCLDPENPIIIGLIPMLTGSIDLKEIQCFVNEGLRSSTGNLALVPKASSRKRLPLSSSEPDFRAAQTGISNRRFSISFTPRPRRSPIARCFRCGTRLWAKKAGEGLAAKNDYARVNG